MREACFAPRELELLCDCRGYKHSAPPELSAFPCGPAALRILRVSMARTQRSRRTHGVSFRQTFRDRRQTSEKTS